MGVSRVNCPCLPLTPSPDFGALVVVLQDLLIGVTPLGKGEGTPLAHSQAMPKPTSLKDKPAVGGIHWVGAGQVVVGGGDLKKSATKVEQTAQFRSGKDFLTGCAGHPHLQDSSQRSGA